MTLKVILMILICTAVLVENARILGIFHRPSRSHHILGSTLFKALAKSGHQVTMLSPFSLKAPVKNYEDMELTGVKEFNEENELMKKYVQMQNSSIFEKMKIMGKAVDAVTERFLNHTVVKDLLESNRTFDLVIQCWIANEVFLGMGHRFEAPTIAFSTIGSTFITNTITANPAPYSYVPGLMPMFPDQMTFLQRVGNTLSRVLLESLHSFTSPAKQERLRQKYFPNAPPIQQLLSNVSLVLLNSHYSIESPRPYVPSMIQIGGLHIEDPRELEGDLKEFMDSAVNGVVFFSLGSNVKMSDLPKDKLKAIIDSFAKLPLKVLWKFETDDVPNLSPNVKIGKWLPQRDVLAHPNTKLFVTHGGLLSTIEAIYHGVPMIGIPVFGDQEGNVDDGVNKGYAIKLPFLDLSQESLTIAINKILSNPRYTENVKRRSLVLKDQPLKPLDNAVFWVEYVLRHKGAHHLKTSALKLEWYQYYLLDVLAFIMGIVLLGLVGIYLFVCVLVKVSKKVFAKKNKNLAKDISQKKQKSKLA